MSVKRKQHLIPRCYLKAFVDSISPEGVDASRYEPHVWLIEKTLTLPPQKKSVKNAMCKSQFYNLDDDDPQQPIVEEFLSYVESEFSKVLNKMAALDELSLKDSAILCVFVDTLFRRTSNQVGHFQSQIDNATSMYRRVDRAANGNETQSDECLRGTHELAKKSIVTATGIMGNIFLETSFTLLINECEFPFFTSDRPVFYDFLHIDEVLGSGIPQSWTVDGIYNSQKSFFCFCPLTPNIGFLSSPILRPTGPNLYRNTSDCKFIFNLNLMTLQYSESTIVSSKERPFGRFQDSIVSHINELHVARAEQHVRIYTIRNRYEFVITRYDDDGENPIESRVHLWTSDLATIRRLAGDGRVEVLEVFINGVQRRFARNLRFSSISISPHAPSILERDWSRF